MRYFTLPSTSHRKPLVFQEAKRQLVERDATPRHRFPCGTRSIPPFFLLFHGWTRPGRGKGIFVCVFELREHGRIFEDAGLRKVSRRTRRGNGGGLLSIFLRLDPAGRFALQLCCYILACCCTRYQACCNFYSRCWPRIREIILSSRPHIPSCLVPLILQFSFHVLRVIVF